MLFAGFLFVDKNILIMADKMQNDGPYVIYKNDTIFNNYILENKGSLQLQTEKVHYADKGSIKLNVSTDEENKFFQVVLKKDLKNEKTDYKKVKKMFVVSDIEGEFKAFRKLLQGNNIIDKDFNWTFGDGHLVLTGDFFDRGSLVTEVLWLIYSLEDKAEAAGGHVHFILGNHEIMNLSNDLRYVHPKYMKNAMLMNTNYLELYSENSELGKWLRTKNITEKIGDVLFMHAGISDLVNYMQLSLNRMNKLARPFYGDTTYEYNDPIVDVLYSEYGPFWYRGYYVGQKKSSVNQLDSTLSYYNVKHIATGHTVIAETISVLYDGKLFNTDVSHSKGNSEALYIDDGKFYRAKPNGEKILIFE